MAAKDIVEFMTSPSSNSSIFRKPAHVAWHVLDGEVVVLNVSSREMLGFNATGSRIWLLLDGERKLSEIVEIVAQEFGCPFEQAEEDAKDFVHRLSRKLCLSDVEGHPYVEEQAADTNTLKNRTPMAPGETSSYPKPDISWEEGLEENGVYAGCAKDTGGEGGAQCLTNPESISS